MTSAADIILGVLRDTWNLLAVVTTVFAILALLVQFLKGSAAFSLGLDSGVAKSISSVAGVFLFVLVGFYTVPVLARSVTVTAPTCGPVSRLGEFAAAIIGALGALRMLKAVFGAAAMAAAGSPVEFGSAVFDIGVTLLGMLLATVAIPVAAAFFGAC